MPSLFGKGEVEWEGGGKAGWRVTGWMRMSGVGGQQTGRWRGKVSDVGSEWDGVGGEWKRVEWSRMEWNGVRGEWGGQNRV